MLLFERLYKVVWLTLYEELLLHVQNQAEDVLKHTYHPKMYLLAYHLHIQLI